MLKSESHWTVDCLLHNECEIYYFITESRLEEVELVLRRGRWLADNSELIIDAIVILTNKEVEIKLFRELLTERIDYSESNSYCVFAFIVVVVREDIQRCWVGFVLARD